MECTTQGTVDCTMYRRTQAERPAAAARLVEAAPALSHDGDELRPARHVRVECAWGWAGEERGHG